MLSARHAAPEAAALPTADLVLGTLGEEVAGERAEVVVEDLQPDFLTEVARVAMFSCVTSGNAMAIVRTI